MNHIFLEKGAVMQSHPLYRTCVPGLIMQLCWVTGRWELLFYVQNTVRWLALSFMVGVLLVGMVTAELYYCYLLDSCNGMANEIIAKHLLLWLQTWTACRSPLKKMRHCHAMSYIGFRMSLKCSTSISIENVGWSSLHALQQPFTIILPHILQPFIAFYYVNSPESASCMHLAVGLK